MPANYSNDPLGLQHKEPLISPAQGFDYQYHPIRNYCKLIFHEYFQNQLPHRSQKHRYASKVPRLGPHQIGARARRHALDIVDRHLPPDLALLAYDYVLNCPNTLDLNLQRTHISDAAWRLMRFEDQRVLLECFFTLGSSLKQVAAGLVHTPVSVRLSYEDIRIWNYFFFNLNLDRKNPSAYPRQMLHLYLRRLQTWFSRAGARSEKPDPRSGSPYSLADIYGNSKAIPLESYTYQTELLTGTRAVTDTLETYREIFLKPLNIS